MKRFGVSIPVVLLVLAAGCAESTAEKDGKQKTPGGVEYKVLKEGDGLEAEKGDRVTVHYTGKLTENGFQFDSSVGKEPFVFGLGFGDVIRGWDEGVAGMKEGEKRMLYIPSRLGYGPGGMPPVIPPNADLTFEVELLKVEKGKGPPPRKRPGEGEGEGD
jgi:FKBP-type peptidyl-prolyl cis-trans isomerase